MRRWLIAILVFTALYTRYHQPRAWRPEDIRVEGVALGEDLSAVQQRTPWLQSVGERWSADCPHQGVYHTFESWSLRTERSKVVQVQGWHLQVGPHRFAPLQRKSLARLQALLGPGTSPQASIYLWPQYHLKVSVEGNHESVTLVTLSRSIP